MITPDQLPFIGKTPLGRLYLQHMSAAGRAGAYLVGEDLGGEPSAEKLTHHLTVLDGLVGAARVLLEGESFDAFAKDIGCDQDTARLQSHLKAAFSDLPNLPL